MLQKQQSLFKLMHLININFNNLQEQVIISNINDAFVKIMLTQVHPKLPMRNKAATRNFYITQLGFEDIGAIDYEGYLLLKKDAVELHFFEFAALNPTENYGQVYIRTSDINDLYQQMLDKKLAIHLNGALQLKPWGQLEFSMLDPDNNLLTFGQGA